MKNTYNFYCAMLELLVFRCAFLLLFISCENTIENTQTENSEDLAVVSSFLDPNREITVALSTMIPYTEDETSESTSIKNAAVYISHKEVEYLLTEDLENPGVYKSTNPELTLVAQDTYAIHFIYNNVVVSGSTTIPKAPENATLSTNSIEIQEFVSGPPSTTTPAVTAKWDNESNDYHTLIIEYLEDNYNPINAFTDSDTYDDLRRTATEPISGDSFELTTRNFPFYGTYSISIYRVNSEYVNLFENISQNSLNLTEPLTNITNGMGIFTGMNAVTLTFEVVPL